MADSSGNEINLRTLRRIDPNVEAIIASASQVAIYKFNAQEWQKLEIEGSLFVFSRYLTNLDGRAAEEQSRYGITVINRLSTTNLIEAVTPELELSFEIPYLLYKNSKKDIYCIWFYSQEECLSVHSTVIQLMKDPTSSASRHNRYHHSPRGTQNKSKPMSIPGSTPTGRIVKNGRIGGDVAVENGSASSEPDVMQMLTQAFQRAALKNVSTQSGPQRLDVNVLLGGSTLAPAASTIPSGSGQDVHDKTRNAPSTPCGPATKQKAALASSQAKTPSVNGASGSRGTKNSSAQRSPPVIVNQPPKQINNKPTPIVQSQPSAFKEKVASSRDEPTRQADHRALTMEELKRTLIHLLTEDADFLHTIHTAYLNGHRKS